LGILRSKNQERDQWKRIQMEPWDYCSHWVRHISPDQRGYRVECIKEIERATLGQYKFDTINKKWGAKFENRPKIALKLLETNHLLRVAEAQLRQINVEVAELIDKINKITHSK